MADGFDLGSWLVNALSGGAYARITSLIRRGQPIDAIISALTKQFPNAPHGGVELIYDFARQAFEAGEAFNRSGPRGRVPDSEIPRHPGRVRGAPENSVYRWQYEITIDETGETYQWFENSNRYLSFGEMEKEAMRKAIERICSSPKTFGVTREDCDEGLQISVVSLIRF